MIKTYEDLNGNLLVINHRKSAVFFETGIDFEGYNISFKFNQETFLEVLKHIKHAASESWSNIEPRDATSESSDYYEYYDREFDNNGLLSLKENKINLHRPIRESNRLYKFNKRKMETFLFDCQKYLKESAE